MTAAKAIKSEGEGVVVDTSETGQLPDVVAQAFRSVGGSLPTVIFADPAMKNVYGSFGHSQLKSQDYRAVFRDTKRKIREAVKDGSFETDLSGAKEEVAGNEAEGDAGDEDAVPAGRIMVEESELEMWRSAKGSQITAKLVAVEGEDTFIFETAAGKEIRVTAAQLSVESMQKARKMAGL